jgi:hypothetical protein
MAYSINGLAKLTSSGNSTAPNWFCYKSTADTLATITTSAYFNSLVPDLTNGVGVLKVGDIIYCEGSDDQALNRVTAVTTNVTVADFIDSSSISDGQLTAAKTALAQGSVMIGNASGYGSALDMSGAGNVLVGGGTTAAAVDLSAGGNILVGNDTTAVALDASTDAQILVGNGTTITSVAVSGDVTIDNAGAVTIAAGAVDKAMLAATTRPSHMIVYADQVTTTGGAAAEAFTVTGAVGATDYAFVQIVDDGTGSVTLVQAVVTDNTLTVTFSANPQNDTTINYQIVRATS